MRNAVRVCVGRKCGTHFFKIKTKGQAALLTAGMLLLSLTARCQEGGAGVTNATEEVKKYFSIGTDLLYAVGAVMGLVGAVKVYTKWNSGEQDTAKTAASWFGSCIFLLVVATILKGFFKV